MTTKTATDPRTVIPTTPPRDWQREAPIYRVRQDTRPAPKDRFRLEPPYSSCSDGDVWQYGDRLIKAGEVITTTLWPHPAFIPLNYTAAKILEFFVNRPKSRLPQKPYDHNGKLRLSDGLLGSTPRVVAPQPERVRLDPVNQTWPGL